MDLPAASNIQQPEIKESILAMNKPIVLIVTAILLIVLSSLTAYFFLQSRITKQTSLQPIITPTTMQTIVPTIIPNETAYWKTYSNTTYKFSFKYPDTWKYNENVGIYFGDTTIVDNSHYRIALSFDSKDYLTLKNTFSDNSIVVNINGKEGLTHFVISLVPKKDYKLPSSFTGDVIPPDAYESKVTAYEALVPLGFKTLRIYSLIETKEVVDQILSTFRFD